MMIQLLMLRHGQPQRQNCLLGKTDSALSEEGWQQLQQSCHNLKDISLVITSPLVRCSQFANDYAVKNGIDLICDPLWQECDFGDWDGIKYSQLQKDYSKEFAGFLNNPAENTPPNGEPLRAFNERVEEGINHLVKSCIDKNQDDKNQDDKNQNNKKQKNKRILLVTHGGVIRSLIAWCLKMDGLSNYPFQRLAVEYASISQINIYSGEQLLPQLIKLNQLPEYIDR